MEAILALEDGTIFKGKSFGATGERTGEVVFNTSMTGYQEILTDPSYKGQIVTMTYPLIGNYGINSEDIESAKPQVEGFAIKELSPITSNWRSQKPLDEYLKENNILGIEGIDTRALTRHIRLQGAMKAVLSTEALREDSLVQKAKDSLGVIGQDLVKNVTLDKVYQWNKEGKYKVIVIDCGVKYNILRNLVKNDCQVTIVPARTEADKILNMKPDGILLSNGPGDPAAVHYVVNTVKKLLGKIPIFGICFGHQILGLALGGKTYKLKFGHHGGNHPVKDLKTGKIDITTQNHGFCVEISKEQRAKSQELYYMTGNDDVEVTHINLNDRTCEGMRHKKLSIMAVQFHPEAGPGPHDATYLFEQFVEMMKK